ncbi:putative Digestive cysteine proteinase 1 [Paratrimastix pyriformis]|uniref:Digestive cysteine proteinase 1 n=1 Tax=Paratrimastix pyriformis TaxID=342808 RepID=A0ABQ8U4C3_9EUKA|nr:putative Digestive cysteine proteinase 1 [Paratrimastix pyriformis]
MVLAPFFWDVVVVLGFLSVTFAGSTRQSDIHAKNEEFRLWMKQNNRHYSGPGEAANRAAIWRDNLAFIEKSNAEGSGIVLGMNQFGDLTDSEFEAMYLHPRSKNQVATPTPVGTTFNSTGNALPTTKNWAEEGAVTPVKNQGSCGSCWAFGATGTIEGAWVVQGGHSLASVSEQQLVDCTRGPPYNTFGCDGGWVQPALQYVIDNGGIATEATYPYTGVDGVCRTGDMGPEMFPVKISSYVDLTPRNEGAMAEALVAKGPVAVSIDASGKKFRFYKSGVYAGPCSSMAWKLNHSVLDVGYGTSGIKPYWILKNSWGTSWGMNGYMYIARGRNMCGVATDPTIALA